MKTRLVRFALIALGAAAMSSCGAANSLSETTGRMLSAMSRTVR